MDHSQVELYPAEMQDNLRALISVARSYRDDPDFRRRAASEPRAALAGVGIEFEPPEMEVRICANSEDVVYVAMPPDPNVALKDEESMYVVAGTSTASSAGSAGSATTMSSIPSTISSASSASTVGSAGCAGGS